MRSVMTVNIIILPQRHALASAHMQAGRSKHGRENLPLFFFITFSLQSPLNNVSNGMFYDFTLY